MDEMESTGAEEPRVTTVADAAWKGKIEPYHPSGVLDIPQGVVACQFCGNTRFRRSRVRLGDVKEFLLLRLPLRCMRCNQRQYGYVLTSAVAVGTKTHGPRLARGGDTWKAWTEQEMDGKLHRPMTTAQGPRARNLRHSQPGPARIQTERPGEKPVWRDEDRQIW